MPFVVEMQTGETMKANNAGRVLSVLVEGGADQLRKNNNAVRILCSLLTCVLFPPKVNITRIERVNVSAISHREAAAFSSVG